MTPAAASPALVAYVEFAHFLARGSSSPSCFWEYPVGVGWGQWCRVSGNWEQCPVGRFLRGAARAAEGLVGATVLRAGDSEVAAWPSAYPQKTKFRVAEPPAGRFPSCTGQDQSLEP